jgi:hypothetical protein
VVHPVLLFLSGFGRYELWNPEKLLYRGDAFPMHLLRISIPCEVQLHSFIVGEFLEKVALACVLKIGQV